METIQTYFERPDTPGANSPVGNLMARILAKFPETPFDDARAKAHELLHQAAKRKHYTTPAVLSADQQEKRKAALNVFRQSRQPAVA